MADTPSGHAAQIAEIDVRGVHMRLSAFNRSLSLCARMNYETENLDFIDAMEPDSVFYDLGACEGRFSIYAGLKGLAVFSFEPDAYNYGTLVENLRLNGLQCRPFQVAIGAERGTAVLRIGQPWAGGHLKVVEHPFDDADLTFDVVDRATVPVADLDSLVQNDGWPFPNYLKVDIDGSEYPFLLGARKTLKDSRVKGLLLELSRKHARHDEILAALAEAGLTVRAQFAVPNEPALFNILLRR